MTSVPVLTGDKLASSSQAGSPTYDESLTGFSAAGDNDNNAESHDLGSNDDGDEDTVHRRRRAEKKGSSFDQRDMFRMGKIQQLRRNFRFVSIFGFTMVLMATWEAQLSANIFGLINGGTGGLIWVYIGTFTGFLAAIASMAEMASMAPTTGGQYHWVSEFAPRRAQKFLSYIVGWLCVLGWQVGNTSIGFLASSQILGLAVLNNPSYTIQRWHQTLLIIAINTFCQIFNSFLASRLPLVEGIVLVLHIFGFFAILIPLWVLGPRGEPRAVFFTFTDGGGWGNVGLSCLVGMLSPVFSFIGPDSATHMSEELRDASRSLPRAMMATALVNGGMGFVMIVTFCMTMGGDIEAILATPTGQPFIQVFYNATKSNAAASVMTGIMIIMAIFGNVTNVATSSRQVWAFARDKGLPFSGVLSYVRPGWDIPLNAVLLSYAIAVLLALINIGSTAAFNIITSLGTGALISSYIVSISCLILKRLRREPLLPARWSLGRYGLPINIFSVLFLTLVFIMSFFPQTRKVTPESMNWNVLVYSAVVTFSIAYFAVRGRFRYVGPVEYVRKED
ncbi:amino acid permease-domain-containing protein [Lineolata rhizophorae]|uniref:Amino acid permease-domain-containing protein n=1 Tax=Lineolata rhizophorae TaxID=578093 RepID=A0A6A6NZL1_9PEZI|nr:amino acid permease-domain-containing protein [Lineolata rhizophorae]